MNEYHRYPSGVGRRAWALGYMTPLDAIRVAAWKQAQIPAAMSVNHPLQIETVTADAISKLHASGCRHWSPLGNDSATFWQDYEDLVRSVVGAKNTKTGLYGMKGVEYPTASAILCILDPTMFPVIDQHAVRTIYGTESNGSAFDTATWYCATVYAHYARHLATTVHEQWGGLSIHQLDLNAMRAGKQIVKEATEGIFATRQSWPVVQLPGC